jgi:hypothetical protein
MYTEQKTGGVATLDPATLAKQGESIRVALDQLRAACEKANNWNEIKPLFITVNGAFDKFYTELGVTHNS